MKAQEIFDTVATHLFRQGHRALLEDGISCAYRATNGDMCAVGVLIPDNYYGKDLEKLPVAAIRSKLPEWLTVHMLLLISLQRIHDSVWNWREEGRLRNALRSVAMSYELDDSILDGLSFAVVDEEEEETGDV